MIVIIFCFEDFLIVIMSLKTKDSSTKEGPKSLFNVPTVLYENRYCDQDGFSILICGGENGNREAVNDVYQLKWPNFESIKFPSMLEPRSNCETAVVNSDIFVVGGHVGSSSTKEYKAISSVEMFSNRNKTWCHKTQLPDNRRQCAISSFKQNIYRIDDKNMMTKIFGIYLRV